MGTLGGHLLPGTFFILFALWWSFITAIRYVQMKMKSPFKKNGLVGYKTTVTMPCICLPCGRLKRAPVESYVKLFFAAVGLAGELITGFRNEDVQVQNWPYDGPTTVPTTVHVHNHAMHDMHNMSRRSVVDAPPGYHLERRWWIIESNTQHSTMYSAFIFGAIIEIMVYHKVDLPKFIDYVYGILGYSVECFLFAFHLHGRDILDVHVHTLLVIAILGCIIFAILETIYADQILLTYGRIAFTLLQGTWFWQVGFVLYPPTENPAYHWDLNDHNNVMTITMIYCWHLMLIMLGLIIELFIIKRMYSCSRVVASQWDEMIVIDDNNRSYITTDAQGHEAKFLALNSDDDDSNDEHVEFDGTKTNKIKMNNFKTQIDSSASSTSGNYSNGSQNIV